MSRVFRPGPAFSRLGFGVTGPHASPALTRAASIRLIRDAAEIGVTLFDTGPAYGDGEAETRLGLALAGLERDQVFICTKAGVHAGRRRDFSPASVEASLEASLSRLGSGHVDALLLHGPAPSDLTPALIDLLTGLKTAGRIRHVGVCGRGPEIDAAIASGGFDLVMAPAYAGMAQEDRARIDNARAAGLGVIAIEVMAAARRRLFPPRNAADLWYAARAVKQALNGTGRGGGAMSHADALRWALEDSGADAALTLTTRAAHLADNARLAGLDPNRAHA